MKTVVLGGGSVKNKIWVDEACKKLHGEAIYYEDWLAGKDAKIDFDLEINKVLEIIGNDEVNLVIKSVGSLIGLGAAGKKLDLVNKIIICGVPFRDFSREEILDKYKILSLFNNIICFQNDKDPHGNYEEVREFLMNIKPDIRLVKKNGEFEDTHNYPYFEDFRDFLASL